VLNIGTWSFFQLQQGSQFSQGATRTFSSLYDKETNGPNGTCYGRTVGEILTGFGQLLGSFPFF